MNTTMIPNIIVTLSDTELMAIAEQLYNPNVNEQSVYKQIVGKGNNNESIDELFDEMNSDNFRGTLPRVIALELSNRYRKLLLK